MILVLDPDIPLGLSYTVLVLDPGQHWNVLVLDPDIPFG